jgi:hypothetical protein
LEIELRDGLMGLQEAQEMERAVQDADVLVGGDDRRRPTLNRDSADPVPLRTDPAEIELQPGDRRRGARDAEQDCARLGYGGRNRRGRTQQAGQRPGQLGCRSPESG